MENGKKKGRARVEQVAPHSTGGNRADGVGFRKFVDTTGILLLVTARKLKIKTQPSGF